MSQKRFYFFGILLITSGFFAGACLAQDYGKTLEIGASAPDFSLPGVDGKTYTLKDFSKSPLFAVVFSCNHCPTAQAYEERMRQLAADYGAKGLALIAISSNDPLAVRLDELGYTDLGDTFEDMQLRAKEMDYNFPYLYDGETQAVAKAYGPVATPHIFIFDSQRKLRYQGRIDDVEKPTATPKNTDARNAIEALLAKQPVPVPATKTFGCSLKWADKRHSVDDEKKGWAKEPVAVELIDEAGIRKLIKNDSDKLRLINVWATWCGPCVTEFPDFMTMHHMYRNRDFEFVSISADSPDKRDKVLKFLTGKLASNPNYLINFEDKYKLIEAIDPNWQGALPYTILVEPGGKIVYAKQGPIDPYQMRKAIVENRYMGRYY
ncbi:redoxin domain-containing protein [Arundinibacter roseus]|uniref:Redoxin domain-containing protein n=1 Tax=Arundinibacter roseus TaxID=2070510 RepID=A0A4R4KE62_9BACT|nr:redoxin domain-containing protein [Arundinibacter roseus]TDB65973.1 redoxin domain-containing protein [Arundinibacter roseus]